MPQASDYPDEVEVLVEGRYMLVPRERAEVLGEYEVELETLLTLIRYSPSRVLDALGLKACKCAERPERPECDEWCCRGFVVP